jgi:hypothetical protein
MIWWYVSNDGKEFYRKWSWPNLRHCADICLEGIRKSMKTSISVASRQGRELKPGCSEYEAGVWCLWGSKFTYCLCVNVIMSVENWTERLHTDYKISLYNILCKLSSLHDHYALHLGPWPDIISCVLYICPEHVPLSKHFLFTTHADVRYFSPVRPIDCILLKKLPNVRNYNRQSLWIQYSLVKILHLCAYRYNSDVFDRSIIGLCGWPGNTPPNHARIWPLTSVTGKKFCWGFPMSKFLGWGFPLNHGRAQERV